jgi:hypothetical protein
VKILRLLVTIGYIVTGKTHPRAKPFVLWDQMYEVWRLLEGPVINPTLVREMMVKTRDQGAVWDVPVECAPGDGEFHAAVLTVCRA